MILDQRCIAIMTKIVHAASPVSPQELMEELHVSKRTIYYDIEKINDWLEQANLPQLDYVRSAGFYISEKESALIKKKLATFDKKTNYEFSPKERAAWIAILILTRDAKIYLHDLMETLHVSRSTLLADLKQLKEQLGHFQVELHFHKSSGYYMVGEEQAKRKMLISYLSHLLTNKSWDALLTEIQLIGQQQPASDAFHSAELDVIYHILHEYEPLTGVRYTDEVMQALSAHLLLLIKRFSRGRYIQMDPVEKDVIKRTKEYQAASQICQQLETVFDLNVPEDEIHYIATFLLGAKISDYQLVDVENQDTANLKHIVTLMVDDFQKFACVFFQNREELERNLFIHLKPAYFRIKYGIGIDNPLSSSMQHSYPDLFVLTKKVVHHFEHVLGKPISDDEVAYIAMHFGGWINKEGVKVESRKKAVVVCSSGIGTSRILQKQLEDLLPTVDVVNALTAREYENENLSGIDFVFSTTPVSEKGVAVFVVNPILSHAEKASLLKQFQTGETVPGQINPEAILSIVEKHAHITNGDKLLQELKTFLQNNKEMKNEVDQRPMLNEILTKDKIQFAESANSWQEALQMAAAPLLADQSISQGYIDTMIENVHQMGPYIVIAPGIALPHARPEAGVNKLGMSFLQLRQSCSFSEKAEHQVSLLFVLAAIDNDTHLTALSQLSKMLSDRDNIEKLQTAQSADEVLPIINQYSHI
ncbi:BglG family transcription antiterminator [Halalkalibacter oceani]|uniref:BglG family transcription antiterminator n=1 Tax=Halalkalibacter oceani TaxID=1653776 RepID=UPI00339562D9